MFDSFVSAKISVLSVAGERNTEENGPDAWLVTNARSLFSACPIFLPDKEGWYINPRVEDSAWRAEGLNVGSA